jgi:hypothetical protein
VNPRGWAILGATALLSMVALRVAVLVGPVPSGIDGGNWLAFGTFERAGSLYPPVVPWLFAGLAGLLGPAVATTVAAAGALCVPALVVLGVARWSGQGAAGSIAALAVMGSGALGEAAAWGGYPQVIATGLALAGLTALAAYADDGKRRHLIVFGVSFAMTVGTSHLEAVPTIVAIVIVTTWSIVRHGRRGLLRAAAVAIVCGLPLIALARTYLALFGTLGVAVPNPPDAARILGPAWAVYILALAAGPGGVAALLLRRRRGDPELGPPARAALVAAAGATSAWGLVFVVSGEARLLHDVAVLVPFSLVAVAPLVRERLRGHWSAAPLALVACGLAAFVAGTGLAAFPEQVSYYRVLTRDSLVAMQWLAQVPAIGNDEIVVADQHGAPLGWWTEGIVGREVFLASDLRWLRFASERSRARSANALLYGSGFPSGASAAQAAASGIGYILLPQASAFGISAASPPPAWSVAFASGNAVVLAPTALILTPGGGGP